ncbi:MAG: hypothetical protein MUP28_06235 [Candidatus Aminicenantes bacterium]|jgi:hypothetical protein|nr:hypothetical protein [Candidatus Aminicenantes bacterium]
MSFGAYGLLVIFGLFILLLAINPKLSCFGKRIASPLYPLVRKRRLRKKAGEAGKTGGEEEENAPRKKTKDYGFHLD